MLILKSDEYMGDKPSIYALNRSPQDDFPEHCHDFSELVLVCSGSGIHVKNDSQKVILPNSVNVITDKDYHLYENTNDVRLVNICYKKSCVEISEKSADILKNIEYQINNITVTKESFELIHRTALLLEEEQMSDNKHSETMVTLLFERLLLQIDRLNVGDLTDNQIVRAIVYLCDNYKDRELSIAEVCNQFEVTPAALNSRLVTLTGVSANKFVNALRINKAKKMFEKGSSVTDVAFHVGFNDSNYFSTKFKVATGLKPTDYMKSFKS